MRSTLKTRFSLLLSFVRQPAAYLLTIHSGPVDQVGAVISMKCVPLRFVFRRQARTFERNIDFLPSTVRTSKVAFPALMSEW